MLKVKSVVGVMLGMNFDGVLSSCTLGQDTNCLIELAVYALQERRILTLGELEKSVHTYYQECTNILEEQNSDNTCPPQYMVDFDEDALQAFLTEASGHTHFYVQEDDENQYWYAFSLDYVPYFGDYSIVKFNQLSELFQTIDPDLTDNKDGTYDLVIDNVPVTLYANNRSSHPCHYDIKVGKNGATIQPKHIELKLRLCLAVHTSQV